MRKGSRLLTWAESYELRRIDRVSEWYHFAWQLTRRYRGISMQDAKAIIRDCADKIGIRTLPWHWNS